MRSHPIFARAWDVLVRLGGRQERENRREMAGPASGLVLDLGAGTGLNFAHYRRARLVIALEPEPTMARRALRRAGRAPVGVRVIRGVAEHLPFPDNTFDAVVASLVLCTVQDPLKSAAEIRRVLRPRGTFRFYEHVRSLRPRAARMQDRMERPWGVLGAGCHPNRDTVATLRRAGFEVRYRRLSVGPPSPVRPHVLGTAQAGGSGGVARPERGSRGSRRRADPPG